MPCLLKEVVVLEMKVIKEVSVKCRHWLSFDLEKTEEEHLDSVVVSIIVRCC